MARNVPPAKIAIVPVWLDPDEIRPDARDNAWRHEQKIPIAKKVILYAGTIGIVSGAAVVLDAAELLRDRRDVVMLFVGEGQVKEAIESDARRRRLGNVRFLPFQPRIRVREVLATADVSLVTLAPGRGRTSVPSKVVGYMAAGRPVLAAVDPDSDTAVAVREAHCGLVVPPGSGAHIADAIERLLDDHDLPLFGRKARAYFERTYARGAALKRFRQIIDEVQGLGEPVR